MTATAKTKMVRYSETRDIIYNYLYDTKAHPSAEMIYNDLKIVLPKLSCGVRTHHRRGSCGVQSDGILFGDIRCHHVRF